MAWSRRLRRATALLVVFGALSGSACGGGGGGDKAAKLVEIPPSAVPAQLMGMQVQPEPALELAEKNKRPFIEAVGLFSMRADDLLQATLQVSRFSSKANIEDRRFRDTVAAQIGDGTPQVLRMGKELVYVTAGRKQSLSVWFKDHTMFVLGVREEYDHPRALLRQALEIKP